VRRKLLIQIVAPQYGVRGIVDEDFVDLSMETRANLEAVAATPSSALGSTRDKPDVAYCRGIFATLRAHGAAWFLYIGGNDTAESTPRASEPQIPSKCSSPPWLDRPRRPAAPTRRACAADRGG